MPSGGPMFVRVFVRVCPYFPFSTRIWLNQDHWLAHQMKQAGIRFEAKRKCLLPVKRSGSAAEDSRLPHVNTCCVGWPSVWTGGSKCGCGKNGGRADEMGAGRKGEGRKSEPARPAGSGPAEGSRCGKPRGSE